MKNRSSKDLSESLIILKENYNRTDANTKCPGYIQFVNMVPFLVALYKLEDLQMYESMVSEHALVVDATCNITAKVDTKRVFDFPFLFYDREVRTEPVPVL